jgi:hypothetical protein
MTTLLQKAFAEAEKLPSDEQDVLAARLLEELAAEDAFDRKISQTSDKLAKLARAAIEEHRAGLSLDLDAEE